MRVALLQFYGYGRQPTADYEKIAWALRMDGHTAWVATPDSSGNLLWDDGETIHAVTAGPQKGSSKLSRRYAHGRFMQRVRNQLRDLTPHIVQVNPANVYAYWLLGRRVSARSRSILDWRQIGERTVSNQLDRAKAQLFYRQRYLYSTRLFDGATFLHPAGAERVLGSRWAAKGGYVVPMGVDDHFLSTAASALPPRRGGKVRFLYIGSIGRIRKLEMVLAAAAQLHGQGYPFELHFMGPDYSDGYYADECRSLGISEIVHFRPPIPYEEVPSAALTYDVALAVVPEEPADWQYHPTLKVLEYRALGIPIIGTDFVSNRDYIEDGANGILVGNDSSEIASAMRRFIENRHYLNSVWQRAQQMRQGDVWREIARTYLKRVYLPLLQIDDTTAFEPDNVRVNDDVLDAVRREK